MDSFKPALDVLLALRLDSDQEDWSIPTRYIPQWSSHGTCWERTEYWQGKHIFFPQKILLPSGEEGKGLISLQDQSSTFPKQDVPRESFGNFPAGSTMFSAIENSWLFSPHPNHPCSDLSQSLAPCMGMHVRMSCIYFQSKIVLLRLLLTIALVVFFPNEETES